MLGLCVKNRSGLSIFVIVDWSFFVGGQNTWRPLMKHSVLIISLSSVKLECFTCFILLGDARSGCFGSSGFNFPIMFDNVTSLVSHEALLRVIRYFVKLNGFLI